MGFAQGLRAGSDTVARAFDGYYAARDRRERQEKEAAIEAELKKLETPKQALVMPKAEFSAEGAPGLQGFGVAPQATGGARGLEMSSMPAPQTTGFEAGNVAPTPRELSASEREAVYGNIARIKGDIAGMRQSDQNRAALKVKDAFSQYMKEFDSDNDGHVDTAIRQLNTTDGVVTIGDPDKKGYRELSFVDGDGRGRFTKLSRAEQAQLYAAGQMMGEYPEEALARISEVNKDLAASLARANGIRTSITDANNRTNNLRNDDVRGDSALQLQREQAAANDRYRAASLANQRAGLSMNRRSGDIREFVDANGRSVLIDIGAAPRDGSGAVQLPAGLLPKTVRPQLSQAERAKLAVDYAQNSGIPLGEAMLEIEQLYAAQASAGAVGGPQGLADPGLVDLNGRAAPATAKATPAPAASQAAPQRPMTLREMQQVANQAQRTPVNLRGLVVGEPAGQTYDPEVLRLLAR